MPNTLYFCIDNVRDRQELNYEAFANDFGPLNLAMMYRFCVELERILDMPEVAGQVVYHYCTTKPPKRANAACLMGAFQVMMLGRTAEEAWEAFANVPPFPPYVDASIGNCTYACTILHCLKGLETAIKLGWFNRKTFNVADYEFNSLVENGDFNWIVPGKLIAFSCPSDVSLDSDDMRMFTPDDYVPVFKRLGVTAVVRLNKRTYEADSFTRGGIHHYDLYFVDGSCPEETLIQRFLSIAETERAVAVHCKAGLGRTGTLIACYAMKHFSFPPAELIAWLRLCRPGSVLGPQQQFLHQVYKKCLEWGKEYREQHDSEGEDEGEPVQDLKFSAEDAEKAVYGDLGQAERLLSAKRDNQKVEQKEVHRRHYKVEALFIIPRRATL